MPHKVRWYNDEGSRWCSGCQDYIRGVPAEMFPRDRHNKRDGLYNHCKACTQYSSRRYWRTNRFKHELSVLAWRARNPKKMKRIWQRNNIARRAYQKIARRLAREGIVL